MDSIEKRAFIQAVYDVVKTIPYGRATSYGAIAKAIGYPHFSRMVGHVMAGGYDSDEDNIPAHRVVNSQGVLSGRDSFGNSGEMQQLLEKEGVVVINNKIKNWKKIFWNPLKEINITPNPKRGD